MGKRAGKAFNKIFKTINHKALSVLFFTLVTILFYQNCGNYKFTEKLRERSSGNPTEEACLNGTINFPVCNQCPAGFNFDNNTCVALFCVPGTTTALGCPTIVDGTSSKTCNAQGTEYGECNSVCNSGYAPSGNQPNISCTPTACGNGAINPPTCNTCPAGQYYDGTSCQVQVCTPYSTTPAGCPTVVNGTSIKTCNAQGSDYGSCVSTCNGGYNASGSQPNITCTIAPCTNGANNPPTCNTCAAGFYFDGTNCVAQVCTPGTVTPTGCPTISNGSSIKTCNAQGSAYGSCTSSCNSGYNLSGSQPNITCTIAPCTNGAINPPTCNTCSTGQYFDGTNCVPQICAPGSSTSTGCPAISNGSSIKTCNAQGSAYGSCTSSCNSGYNLSGSQPNITCTIAPCTNGAINPPTCNTCAAGFYYDGSSCAPQICSPGSTTSYGCPVITNGSSIKTCNAQGSAYGSCTSSCNSGYNLSGSQPNITCTIAPCTNGAINPPTCNTCAAGFYYDGTSCVPQICSPGSITSYGCPAITNGSSIKTCNTQGSAYGSCTSSCNSGYSGSGAQPNISCCVSSMGSGCSIPPQRHPEMDWDGAACYNYSSNCKFPSSSPYEGYGTPLYGPIPDVPVNCGPCLGQGICWMHRCEVWDRNSTLGTLQCDGSCAP